jgi:hypothetical protein
VVSISAQFTSLMAAEGPAEGGRTNRSRHPC